MFYQASTVLRSPTRSCWHTLRINIVSWEYFKYKMSVSSPSIKQGPYLLRKDRNNPLLWLVTNRFHLFSVLHGEKSIQVSLRHANMLRACHLPTILFHAQAKTVTRSVFPSKFSWPLEFKPYKTKFKQRTLTSPPAFLLRSYFALLLSLLLFLLRI